MVKAYVRYYAKNGGYDISAVESTAEPYLYNGNVYPLFFKIFEGESCRELKERGMQRFKERSLLFNKLYYSLLAYAQSVNAYALPKVDEVRRGVKPHLVAFLLQNGSQRVRA